MLSLLCSFFFFFKQKTAYEMRISDWSSDVCSSDLRPIGDTSSGIGEQEQIANNEHWPFPAVGLAPGDRDRRNALRRKDEPGEKIGRASCRERVCQYV